MTRDDLASRARQIVAQQLDIPIERVTDDATFMQLGADSLDRIDCTFALEEAFDLEIDDDDADTLATFGLAVEYLVKRLGVGVAA